MYYKKDDISIYYEKHGNKNKYIIILPGWGNNRNTFTNIINNLKNEYTIYIIDYPSFGYSQIPNKELNIYDYADLINNFIIDNKIINPIIIAHSFGGRITSILIDKYKITNNKIILIDVAGIKRRKKLKLFLKEKTYKLLKLLINLLPKNRQYLYHKKLLYLFSSKDYFNIPSTMKKTFKNIINEDLRKHYKNIKNKTLIIWGNKDIDTPLKDGKYLKKHLINSKLIIYKNSNHFSYLEYPNITNKIINTFLKEK